MSNAGYGNHDADRPGGVPDTKPAVAGDAKSGGTIDEDGVESSPVKEADHAKTPGAGAMPDGRQGGEVDPGAG